MIVSLGTLTNIIHSMVDGNDTRAHFNYSRTQSTHRVAMADFGRTFHHDGKICSGWWGWGVYAHPLSLYLPSHTKLQCTYQLRGHIHTPSISSLFYMYSVVQEHWHWSYPVWLYTGEMPRSLSRRESWSRALLRPTFTWNNCYSSTVISYFRLGFYSPFQLAWNRYPGFSMFFSQYTG